MLYSFCDDCYIFSVMTLYMCDSVHSLGHTSQNKVTYEFLLRIHASKSSDMPNTSQVVPADEMWVTGQLGEVGVLPLSFSLF